MEWGGGAEDTEAEGLILRKQVAVDAKGQSEPREDRRAALGHLVGFEQAS